ncbi:MAG: 3'-5' exonuclease [Betaproteobacteria bacterium]
MKRLFGGGPAAAADRWVVVDVETSGMDVASDGLLSIGAVAIGADGRVRPADSLEIVLRQQAASGKQNILVHGIGVQAQLSGVDPPAATRAFLDYVGTSPIVAFHAPFDRGFLARAVKVFVNQPFDNPWLDLAELAPALDPKARAEALDEWLARYGIPVVERHSAAADALATALLAARRLPHALRQGAAAVTPLQRLAKAGRWLSA